MKKLLFWLAASALVMLLLPWLAVTLLKGVNGMAACLVLFFALNPLYALLAGAWAGLDAKKLWSVPLLTALFFLAGTWLFFDMGEPAFILYASVYLLLGAAAMLLPRFIRKKR